MRSSWGRFTARGGPEIEDHIAGIMERVAAVFRQQLAPESYTALVLIGGYGRGEGGVARAGGKEIPHNNFDFLLITSREMDAQPLRHRIEQWLEPLRRETGVRLDLSILSASQLRRAAPLLIWCDMRCGHKTLLGDPAFVPGLAHFDLASLPPTEIRNLVVNRGTLLLINDLLLERNATSPANRQLVIRHAIKAIIGYGDALLFQRGDYDSSYREKQRRMAHQSAIPETFRSLYHQAMEFRFEPRYENYLQRDLAAWMCQLRRDLSPLHLQFESWRLGVPLPTWDAYPEPAFRAALTEGLASLRGWGRKILGAVRGSAVPRTISWTARVGARCCGQFGALPILFPAAAYHPQASPFGELARALLHAPSADPAGLRLAYLRRWGAYSDTNFTGLLERIGLTLEPQPRS